MLGVEDDLREFPEDRLSKAMIAYMRRSNSLETEVAALKSTGTDAKAYIDRLQLLLKTIYRVTYGRSAEKLDDSQYAFAFEEAQTSVGTVDAILRSWARATAKVQQPATTPNASRTRRGGYRARRPALCVRCMRASERHNFIAPNFRMIVTRRPPYACERPSSVAFSQTGTSSSTTTTSNARSYRSKLHARTPCLRNLRRGGDAWATIASLPAAARLNYVDPIGCLTQTLERIAASLPNKDIDALLPQNFVRS